MDEPGATDVQLLMSGSTLPPRRSTNRPAAVCQRFRVRLGRWGLDRELADGRPTTTSELHARRARQLVDPGVRAQLAGALRSVVDDAGRPYVVLHSVPLGRPPGLLRLRSAEVLAWREGLLGLAERLDAPTPVSPCGVARTRILLADATGPLYNRGAPRPLGETIWWIADGLHQRPAHRRGSPADCQAGSGAPRSGP